MNLFESLGQEPPLKLAVVGAGGKTSAVFTLARQVPGKAWVTTTTHMGVWQVPLSDQHIILGTGSEPDPRSWPDQKVTLVTGSQTADNRLCGPENDQLNLLDSLAKREMSSLIIEADGARSLPIQAPAEHEPVIPTWVNTVIVVVGLGAIGKPLGPEWVHHPEIFSSLTGLPLGQAIRLRDVAALLQHPQGGLKGIPPGSQKIVLLNQADLYQLSEGEIQELQSLALHFDRVLAGSLKFDPDHFKQISPR